MKCNALIFLLFFSFLKNSKAQNFRYPDSFDWADNPKQFIGSTIVLDAFYSSNDNKYVIYQQERSEGGYRKYKDVFSGRWETDYTKYDPTVYYCYKKFKEYKTGKWITVNIPQRFWDNNGESIPKTYGSGLYKLTLKVSSVEPQNVCNGNHVSGSGSNSIFYTLESINRYNY